MKKSTAEDEFNLSFPTRVQTAAIHKRDKHSVGRLGLNVNNSELAHYTVGKVGKSHTGVTWQTEYRSSRDLNRPGEPADWPNGFPIFAPPELGSLSDLRSDCEKSSLLLEDGYCVLCTCRVGYKCVCLLVTYM